MSHNQTTAIPPSIESAIAHDVTAIENIYDLDANRTWIHIESKPGPSEATPNFNNVLPPISQSEREALIDESLHGLKNKQKGGL